MGLMPFCKSCFIILRITGRRWFLRGLTSGGLWVCVDLYVCGCVRPEHETESELLNIIEHLPIRILRQPHHGHHGVLAEKCSIGETRMNYFRELS